MTFTDQQLRKLKASVRPQFVKERDIGGKILHYLEGWHIISEANRIFGFEGWDRETVHSQCVWQKQIDYGYAAAYLTRVKITVRAGEKVIQREGLGSGEAVAQTAGQAHERASKAAETDATKRALSTFGNPFGLSLYRDKTEAPQPKRSRRAPARKSYDTPESEPASDPADDQSQALNKRQMIQATMPVWVPAPIETVSEAQLSDKSAGNVATRQTGIEPRIDKSDLPIGEPKRIRSREHLRYVASQPCLACGRSPSQAHHLRFAQPRALGKKVSDEYTVPLCAMHHHELHMRGNEKAWWEELQIEPLNKAEELWLSRGQGV